MCGEWHRASEDHLYSTYSESCSTTNVGEEEDEVVMRSSLVTVAHCVQSSPTTTIGLYKEKKDTVTPKHLSSLPATLSSIVEVSSPRKQSQQTTIKFVFSKESQYHQTHENVHLCNEKLAKMLAKDLSFSLVEGDGFLDFVEIHSPKWKVPSWTCFHCCCASAAPSSAAIGWRSNEVQSCSVNPPHRATGLTI